MFNPTPLTGKVALIAGASGGIGAMIARALGVAGAALVLVGRTPQRVRALRESLLAAGLPDAHHLALAADLTDAAHSAGVVRAALGRFSQLDILINAAGVGRFAPFDEMTLEAMLEVLHSNLTATMLLTHHATPALIARRGHVINLGSGLGQRPAPKAAAFTAAKFGVRGFSQALRLDMARHGVRVSCISPAGAGVDTDFWRTADPEARRVGMLPPERIAEAVLFVLTARDGALVDELTIRTP